MLKIISIVPPITEKRPFKKLKILSFLVPFISKIKTADIFNFVSVKYFGKGLLLRKTWHIRVEIAGHQTCYFVSFAIA